VGVSSAIRLIGRFAKPGKVAHTVIALDKSAGFYAGRYNWPEVDSTEALLKGISEFEARVSQTVGTLYSD
jgi:hypothetical protein